MSDRWATIPLSQSIFRALGSYSNSGQYELRVMVDGRIGYVTGLMNMADMLEQPRDADRRPALIVLQATFTKPEPEPAK